jgi:hypothetical protein
MQSQAGPFLNASSKVISSKEFLEALASVLAIAALMELALPILSLLLTP